MTETTERGHSSLNTLQEETNCKTVDKETVDVEAENDKNSSTASIAHDKNEDTSNIQTEAITAAENLMVGAAVSNEQVNTSIPDTAPALNSTLETDSGEGISGGTGHRTSVTECRSAASILGKMCEDSFKFLARARELKSTVNTSTSRLTEHMEVFEKKVAECSRGIVKDFYYNLAMEYGSFCQETDKIRNMETAADTCIRYADGATEIKVQDVDKTPLKEFAEAICDFLEKERAVCLNMEKMWTNVQTDLQIEETRRLNAEKKIRKVKKWGLFVTFMCVLFTATTILNMEPVKIYVTFVIGLLTIVLCIFWWLRQLYRCLKKRCNRTIEDQWLKMSFPEGILNDCKQRLEITNKELEEYRALNLGEADEKNLDTQFPTTDSYESADDSSQ